MRRKGKKKCRKSALRVVADTPSVIKENSFCSIFGQRKDVHNFRNSSSESPATRSCSFSSSNRKSSKRSSKTKGDPHKKKQDQWLVTPLSSVAFYIPLNGSCYLYNDEEKKKNGPRKTIIDWNNFVLFSHLPEEMNKIYYYKPTVLPELRLKFRTTFESSTNSEDSFIRFESGDDVYKPHRDCETQLECTRYSSSPKASSSFPNIVTKLQSEKTRTKKKVRFADNTDLVTVHFIIAWDYAYRAARISPWETMARDSTRFKLKIKSLAPILNPILSHEHRAEIWETRMRYAEIEKLHLIKPTNFHHRNYLIDETCSLC